MLASLSVCVRPAHSLPHAPRRGAAARAGRRAPVPPVQAAFETFSATCQKAVGASKLAPLCAAPWFLCAQLVGEDTSRGFSSGSCGASGGASSSGPRLLTSGPARSPVATPLVTVALPAAAASVCLPNTNQPMLPEPTCRPSSAPTGSIAPFEAWDTASGSDALVFSSPPSCPHVPASAGTHGARCGPPE